ncbi:hypothetical protein ASG19_04350 [Rhizobium sp. Leaf306]|uniref:hypothetical protein n=1 Tax=Rhizobium sp. Leaf306 TaxID=1736330 RepID=UPI000715B68A|nr:hypothetical protein [Rhizobium sp. Leaf306]KQQ38293.1 hypothetical protein ASG19_04350 [Rhizobium sp. Leaf306]
METETVAMKRAVLRRLPKSEFSVLATVYKQPRRAEALAERAYSLHTDWDSLDDGRRSAACLFEWGRLQIFTAVEVLPRLEASFVEFFHVTLADKRWRVPPKAASVDAFHRPRRKVRAAIQYLRDNDLEPIYVVAYEISGDRNLTGDYSFEPHAHILIGGVRKAVLKAAFRVRLPRSMRGRDKPVKIKPVPPSQLGNVLGYLTKVKPQDRVEFRRSDGRLDRKSNRMPPQAEAQWLRCLALVPMTQLVQFGGFADSLSTRFSHREMATLIGAL